MTKHSSHEPDASSKQSFELLKLEYEALRKEICQSIDKQHQILLAGYAAIAALFSYAFAKTQSTALVPLSIPCVCLFMSALWTVECNRMVRASYYIGYVLWREMRTTAAYAGIAGWESWIRSSRTGAKGTQPSHASAFRLIQSESQYLVVLVIPVAVSLIAIALVLDDLRTNFNDRVRMALLAVYVFALVMAWKAVSERVISVSDLASICPKDQEHLPDREPRLASSLSDPTGATATEGAV